MYKKMLCFGIILFIMFGTHSVNAASPPYKTIETTQLKSSKQSNAKTILTLRTNTRLKIINKTNTWAYVQVGKSKGYLPMRSVIPFEIPFPKNGVSSVMSYKGTDIVSISGVSYKIDPALKPFFKKNSSALRSMLVVPKTKDRTLVGWKKLSFFSFRQPVKSLVIDKAAASRIDSLSIPRTDFTITTAAPLRQVVADTYAHYNPSKGEEQTLTLNGQVEQLHTAGAIQLAGKGTIERWDISKDTNYSHEIPVRYTGEIGFLNIRNIDAVVRGTRTLKIRTVAAPTNTHVLAGKNGVIGSIKTYKTVRGKKMGKAELAIDKMFLKLNKTSVAATLDTLKIPYTKARIADYVTALQQNEAAGPNKRLVNSVTDLKEIVRLVDTVMTTKETTQAYVHATDNRLTVQTFHEHVDNETYSNQYDRAVTATLQNDKLTSISFKRPKIAKMEWSLSSGKDQFFLYDLPAGSNQIVTIDGKNVRSFTIETKEVKQSNNSSSLIELMSINNKPLSDFQKEPPRYDAKVIEDGYRTYVAVRSSDKEWLRNIHFYNVTVNANYKTGGSVSTDRINLGDWKESETVIFNLYDTKRLNELSICSFGYKDAISN